MCTLGLFINVHFILESIENINSPKTTVEENNPKIPTSVQAKILQSCVQVGQNVSEDFMQGQLSQWPRAFPTKTGELVEQGQGEFKIAEENTLIDQDTLPHNGIVQKIKLLEKETPEDTQEPNQKNKSISNLPLVRPHSPNVDKAAPIYGPEEDAEHPDIFRPSLLNSICTDDLPDLEDAEITVASPIEQPAEQKILIYPEETY